MPTHKRFSAQWEGIIVRTRWGWGPSASAKKLIKAFGESGTGIRGSGFRDPV